MNNLKFSIYINQQVLAETPLDLLDGAILDYIHYLCGSTHPAIAARRFQDEQGLWTWLDLKTLSTQMPLLKIKDYSALSRRLKTIETVGYIGLLCVREKGIRKLYVRKTPLFDSLLLQNNRGGEPIVLEHKGHAQPIVLEHKEPIVLKPHDNSNTNNSSTIDSREGPNGPSKQEKKQENTLVEKGKNGRIVNRLTNTIGYLTGIPEADSLDFVAKFPHLTQDRIVAEGERAYHWLRSKGRSCKDYKSFLRNWLDKTNEALSKDSKTSRRVFYADSE